MIEGQESIRSPTVEPLVTYRNSLMDTIDRTWRRRIILESLAKTPVEKKFELFSNPRTVGLFSSDLVGTYIREDSGINTLGNNPTHIQIESFLLQKAIEDDPEIGNIKISDLPPEVFSRPDDKSEIAQISALFKEKPGLTLEKYFESNPSYIPLMESILDAKANNVQAEIGLEVLSDPAKLQEYYKNWLDTERNSGLRIVRTPTHQSIITRLRSLDRIDGRNRTIAKAILYGPPGTGKSELVRVLNGKKKTLVISGRPYLSYDELIGSPSLISDKSQGAEAALAQAIQHQDASSVTQLVIKLSEKYVENLSLMDSTGKKEPFSTEQEQQFKSAWFRSIGFDEKTAEKLSTGSSADNPQVLNSPGYSYEQVKSVFSQHLLFLAAEKTGLTTRKTSHVRDYMEGLIIMADKMGMNVLLDEAEKMFEGQISGTESFAGLEDLLVQPPGAEITIGNRTHRLSDDFGIAITMNSLSIPPHIISRFSLDRTIYVGTTGYDRVSIAAVDLINGQGKAVISQSEQEKLVFLLTYVWPALETASKVNKSSTSVDLRIMNTIIASLSHNGRPTGTELSTALAGLSHDPIIGPILARFEGLLPQIDLTASLKEDDITSSKPEQTDSFLVEALLHSAVPVTWPYANKRKLMTEEQIQKFANTASSSVISGDTTAEGDFPQLLLSDSCQVNIVNNRLVFSHPSSNNRRLYTVTIDLSTEGEQKPPQGNLGLVAVNSSGNIIVLSQRDASGKSSYFAVDASGVISKDLDPLRAENSARRISEIISPENASRPPTFSLTPDGRSMFVLQNGKLSMHQLGLFQDAGMTKNFRKPIPLSLSDSDTEITSFEMSKNGNFALIKFSDGSCNVLDITTAVSNRQPHLLANKNFRYSDARLSVFENILYLYSLTDKEGLIIY